jgi:uncharacterized protein (DUF433 family)
VFLAALIQNKFKKVPASLVLTRITNLGVITRIRVGERINNTLNNFSMVTADQIAQTIRKAV